MRVTVKYMAQVRHAAGTAVEQVDLNPPCSLAELLAQLAHRREGLRGLLLQSEGQLQPSLLLFVGDRQVAAGEGVSLKDGDVVTVLAPMAGG
jgi:molybdopterin converting factor small subunit